MHGLTYVTMMIADDLVTKGSMLSATNRVILLWLYYDMTILRNLDIVE